MKDTNRILYLFLFVLALGVAFSGINIKFITDDPGLYASIAKNLQYKNSFFQLFTYNQDWLDKPHFPFWCILLSFKLFGISTWAYRLPGLTFFIIGIIYTFLFARRYYGSEIAATAVLILITAQHILLSNTDLRAEPYLMALIMGSIYHISKLEERFTFANLFFTALLTACAIMTKGIFVIIAIYGSLIGQLLFQNKIKQIFSFKWLWLLLLTIIFVLPEFYALYLQFDMHPEKIVFGRNNVSGIKWFLWDSQFGRFVNNGPITRKAQGSVFFYLHTLLWAFAPWCLLFYYAVAKSLKSIFDKQQLTEYYALSGGLLMLVIFSLSRFQLPFYTNAVFPLFAIVTAPVCINKLNKNASTFRLIALWLFVILLPLTVLVVNFFLKPLHNLFFGIDCILFGVLILLVPATIKEAHKKAFFLTVTSALFVGFYLNTVFYNQILPYNGQITAAGYVNLKPFDKFKIYSVKSENNIFQFYCKRPVELVPIEKFSFFKPEGIPIFYINQASYNYLKQAHANFRVIRAFLNYPQENILPKFVDKTTRNSVLDHVYLITK
jgi:4-amino-4-deoxy-L-arabinose transferase-like glycosyltransferase